MDFFTFNGVEFTQITDTLELGDGDYREALKKAGYESLFQVGQDEFDFQIEIFQNNNPSLPELRIRLDIYNDAGIASVYCRHMIHALWILAIYGTPLIACNFYVQLIEAVDEFRRVLLDRNDGLACAHRVYVADPRRAEYYRMETQRRKQQKETKELLDGAQEPGLEDHGV